MTNPVVSNTTPLISLAGMGQLDLLMQVFGSIIIPQQVLHEYQAGARSGDPALHNVTWLHVQPVLPLRELAHLGLGEMATITLALQLNAASALLDDHQARQAAKQRGLQVTGTIGVILLAKQGGVVSTIRPLLDAMRAQGRHISPQLYIEALRLAGEGK